MTTSGSIFGQLGYCLFLFASLTEQKCLKTHSKQRFGLAMAPVLTVIGATGKQGGSVVNAALESAGYKVRALTRNVESEKAKVLAAKGVELVAADVNNKESLIRAFQVIPVSYIRNDGCR